MSASQEEVINSIERLDLLFPELGWEEILYENELPLHPKGSFTMWPLGELNDTQIPEDHCLVLGGWIPNRNLKDFEVFDCKNHQIVKNPRRQFQSTFLASSSESHVSTQGSDELGQADDEEAPLSLLEADKFTKKPLRYKNWLVMLGREHIHTFNLENFDCGIIKNKGESFAEDLSENWKFK